MYEKILSWANDHKRCVIITLAVIIAICIIFFTGYNMGSRERTDAGDETKPVGD